MVLRTNRVRGDIVDPVDVNNIAGAVNGLEQNLTNLETTPLFGSQQEAIDYEMRNPGRVALWWDSGYSPPETYAMNFVGSVADLYATSLNGKQWGKALMGSFGTSEAQMAMSVNGGFAVNTGAGPGAGATINTDKTNMDISIHYDLTGSVVATRQVRVAGRGDPRYLIPGGRPNMPIMVSVRYTGEVMMDPWIDPDDQVYKGFLLGAGAPLVGVLRMTINGNRMRAYVDDTQVGAEQTFAGPQLSGGHAGFGVYQGGKVSRFEVTAA